MIQKKNIASPKHIIGTESLMKIYVQKFLESAEDTLCKKDITDNLYNYVQSAININFCNQMKAIKLI